MNLHYVSEAIKTQSPEYGKELAGADVPMLFPIHINTTEVPTIDNIVKAPISKRGLFIDCGKIILGKINKVETEIGFHVKKEDDDIVLNPILERDVISPDTKETIHTAGINYMQLVFSPLPMQEFSNKYGPTMQFGSMTAGNLSRNLYVIPFVLNLWNLYLQEAGEQEFCKIVESDVDELGVALSRILRYLNFMGKNHQGVLEIHLED